MKPKLRTEAPFAWVSASMTRTRMPRRAPARAVASPTMPAPITARSKCSAGCTCCSADIVTRSCEGQSARPTAAAQSIVACEQAGSFSRGVIAVSHQARVIGEGGDLRHISKGAKEAAEKNDRNERNDRTDYPRHDYVEIARFMSRAAYREQRDHRAVVGK